MKLKEGLLFLRIVAFILVSVFVLLPFRALAWFENNMSAAVVVGQANFTSQIANQTGAANVNANTLYEIRHVFSDGKRLFIADFKNNRVLIYNSIPTTNNASADVVIGQQNFTSQTANQTGFANPNANTLYGPMGVFSDGTRLFIAEYNNNRVLIYNSIPTSNNASADVVIGQQNFTSQTANQTGAANVKANTLYYPVGVSSDGTRLFIAEYNNNRVLIYNSIPTTNNASADVVIGQQNFTSQIANQTGAANVNANTLYNPFGVFSDGKRLFITEFNNNRVLIYNSIPTTNNASADVVIGQQNFTSQTENQTGAANVKANTLYSPRGIFSDGKRLFIADTANNRVLIFNEFLSTLSPSFLNLPNDKRSINLDEGQTITTPSCTIQVRPMSKGLSKVEFYVDNNLICTSNKPDSKGVFSCDWDTTKYHSEIKIIVYYTSGKTATLTRIVTVKGAETSLENVTILPKTGAEVFKPFSVFNQLRCLLAGTIRNL